MSRRLSKKTADRIMNDFVAFIGNGENTRGRFPTNLSELSADCHEFAALATVPAPTEEPQ